MIEIKDKQKCCGCTACQNICPKQCIYMKPDSEGFLYPAIDTEECINCNLCEKVCPIISDTKKYQVKSTYAIRHKDKEILFESTSGGAFTAIAEYTISRGGIVYGAAFDEEFKVVHKCADDCEGLAAFRGSKYVQSDLKDTFSCLKKQLDDGVEILFSGTPCQVAGLNNYLGKEYDNLLTVEVICHGTPSPLLWDKYLQLQQKKGKIKEINFRKKTYGYHSGTMQIVFQNNKKYNGSARVDYMLKSFFSEISSRPSCYECRYKGAERPADLSIFDCWHASDLLADFIDDDKGYTNVFINTDKAKKVMTEIQSRIEAYEVDTEKAIKLDGIMVIEQPHKNKKRDEFYDIVNQNSLEEAVSKFIPISAKDFLIEKSKGLICKLGLTNFFLSLKNKRR